MAAYKMKVALFLGSVRNEPAWGGPARLGTRVGKVVTSYFVKKGHSVTVLDPLELKDTFPVLQKPHHWYKPGTAPAELERIANIIGEADAIVVVSGEYNHSIPPALSNMMDYFGSSKYSYKPSGIVSYSNGQFGGMRAAMALRPFLSELGCLPVSNICAFPTPTNDLDDDGIPLAGKEESVYKRIEIMHNQLNWFAEACANQRKARPL
eukprot:c16563_g1_i1.p1 GENE.c16563_g1_i1~~c16563_g1_i1.p1  ORF type:complete len:208 (+),score=0.25 c16563_g1_i1:55-678(+)